MLPNQPQVFSLRSLCPLLLCKPHHPQLLHESPCYSQTLTETLQSLEDTNCNKYISNKIFLSPPPSLVKINSLVLLPEHLCQGLEKKKEKKTNKISCGSFYLISTFSSLLTIMLLIIHSYSLKPLTQSSPSQILPCPECPQHIQF